MAGIKFNGNFERDLNRAGQGQIKDIASEYQRMLDSLARTHLGKPVSAIKPVLRHNWQRISGDITDPQLTQYAQHISDGTKIRVKI
ncbi:hypothetical protein IWX62_003091 [Arthrobacter sp. CAN_A1]